MNLLELEVGTKQDEQFCFAQGNGCELTYENHSVDIAFSNSVVEHVGSWSEQDRFVKEIPRVGQRVWVQTPARISPVETHFLTLFVHWFPISIRKPLLRWTSIRRLFDLNATEIDTMAAEIRLLTYEEFKKLFYDCEIHTERFWVFPKSYIALRG